MESTCSLSFPGIPFGAWLNFLLFPHIGANLLLAAGIHLSYQSFLAWSVLVSTSSFPPPPADSAQRRQLSAFILSSVLTSAACRKSPVLGTSRLLGVSCHLRTVIVDSFKLYSRGGWQYSLVLTPFWVSTMRVSKQLKGPEKS